MTKRVRHSDHPDGDWQRFVLVHGPGSRARDLSAVLGRSLVEIQQVRASVGSGRTGRLGHDFPTLFELWHGRPPVEVDWPLPAFLPKRGTYEWLPPEISLLASLVGVIGTAEIVAVLTQRLSRLTGDATATRDKQGVLNQIARIGLQASDVLGGITVTEAGQEIGNTGAVRQALRTGQLDARKVGRQHVISRDSWARYKDKIQLPPEGYVQLSTLKGPLGVASDKLSEYSRLNYVPGAVRVNTFGAHSVHTTKFGTWFVPKAVADQLIQDRHAGRPMPWHGKPLLENLRVTWRLYEQRRHPPACETCRAIWGQKGAPTEFEDYVARYPGLVHGVKRHLTMKWTPGLTVAEVAAQAGRPEAHVLQALQNAALIGTDRDGITFISQAEATRWIARRFPTGDGAKSWISIDTAMERYGFTRAEITGFIERDEILSRISMQGPSKGVLYLARHQCASIRESIGFTLEQGAARAKVSVEAFRELLQGVNWRGAAGIPLVTVQAVIKRIQSSQGHTVEEAARQLGMTAEWVNARIQDGTVTLRQNPWDDRAYLTDPMLERLRSATSMPPKEGRLPPEWIRVSRAATIAGVSTTTLLRWAEAGELTRRDTPSGWYFPEDEVRARARTYWLAARFKRDKRPAWLRAEVASQASSCSLTR